MTDRIKRIELAFDLVPGELYHFTASPNRYLMYLGLEQETIDSLIMFKFLERDKIVDMYFLGTDANKFKRVSF